MMMVVVMIKPPSGIRVVLVVFVILVVMMMMMVHAVGRRRLDGDGQRAGCNEDCDKSGNETALEHGDLLDPLIEATIRL